MQGRNGGSHPTHASLRLAWVRRSAGGLVALGLAICTGTCSLAALADGDLAEAAGGSTGMSARSWPAPRFEIASFAPLAATLALPGSVGVPAGPNVRHLEISGWNRPPQASALGLAVGIGTPSGSWRDNGTSSWVDIGVRWRSAPVDQRRIDVAAYRRINQPQDAYTLINSADRPLYSARVEMQFKSAKFGGLAPELGAIGMQLNGGGKVVLRSKRGGPMVYYRSSF